MEVPRSPALWLCRCYVLSGWVVMLLEIIFESLPETAEVLIKPLGISHIFLVGERHP